MEIAEIKLNSAISNALLEIQKPRSKFQLEKFVMGQHDTPEQQYRQTLIEIQELIYAIRGSELRLKKIKLEIQELKDKKNPISEVEAELKELDIEQMELALIGAKRELSDLVGIWENFPHKYTYEEIEGTQNIYWEKRLKRQSILEAVGGSPNQASHLDALLQIGTLSLSNDGLINSENAKELE